MNVLKDKIVKIRKPQYCLMCCTEFPIGTKMKSQTNVYDGEIATIYECETCQTLLNEFSDSFKDCNENMYPADCVCEAFSDYDVKNPQELLIKMREEKMYDNALSKSILRIASPKQ